MRNDLKSSYRYLNDNNLEEIRRLCGSAHSADIARKLMELSLKDVCEVIVKINPHKAARIFNYFQDSFQLKIAKRISEDELALIIDFLEPDEQADIIKRLKPARRKKVLELLPEKDSENASRLAAYPEGTAGSVMTKSFVTVSFNATVAEAKKAISGFEDMQNLHCVYLIDEKQRVCAYIRVLSLLNRADEVLLQDICRTEVISVRALEDQEKSARKLQYYDLLSLPVLDEKGKILGIITYDDAFDVIIKEQTEDMQKIMAMTSSDADNGESYLNISTWQHFKKRISWIVGLALLGLISGYVLHKFEDVLDTLVILAIYMPMLADTGGNTGSQSSTLVIRALALGELSSRDLVKVLFKEFKVSFLISIILMILAFVKIYLLSGGSVMPSGITVAQVGFAISVALGIQVVSATLIGAVLPIAVSSLKLDPAVIAAPALTSIVDITGLLIYFYTVTAMLGIH